MSNATLGEHIKNLPILTASGAKVLTFQESNFSIFICEALSLDAVESDLRWRIRRIMREAPDKITQEFAALPGQPPSQNFCFSVTARTTYFPTPPTLIPIGPDFSGTVVTRVPQSGTNVTLAAANPNRKFLFLSNDAKDFAQVKLGATASPISYTSKLFENDELVIDNPVYKGVVDCIWDKAGTGGMLVTEG